MPLEESRCADGSGEFKDWNEPEWNDGDACIDKCNMQATTKGPGCCEARARPDKDNPTRSYCIYKPNQGLIAGHDDSKAVLCKGGYYKIGKEVSSIESCNKLYIYSFIYMAHNDKRLVFQSPV